MILKDVTKAEVLRTEKWHLVRILGLPEDLYFLAKPQVSDGYYYPGTPGLRANTTSGMR